ncbi:uncharacterized protein BX663DRAFT_505287 [Cokeromyces recurvatus]|uniref:uncharacterized protein n=1 Tax=Cokeromyces recurvatus TaxID=90255 RepID=UPI002220082B|nr:uncharacterized protein BX663DRAFT_505287 [Cokeromyces recurvatus]KAI7903801.1 hypothetical protein BX663DRAFT_505287 [Cokeromyces recurvatus]
MGNQQSLEKVEHVVKEGIDIYKQIKNSQEQYEQNTHYTSTTTTHVTQSTYYHASEDIDDDQIYSELRQRAHEEAEKRNECYSKSQEAYQNGDGAEAKELSNKGHYHDNLMKEYNKKAADHIYAIRNQGRPINEIDLHGLFVKEASEKVEEAIQRCQENGQTDLVIIVGKGLHSPGQIAKLKPAIIELVKKYNVSCQPNIPNPGCLYVEFGKGTGDLSWLNHITDKFVNEQCIIM